MNANKFESPFHFIGNRITKLSIKNDFVSLDGNDKDIKYNLDVDYEVKDITKKEEEHYGLIQLFIKTEAKKGKKHCVIDLTIEGCFSSSVNSEDEFIPLLEINGSTALYSIARSIIINVSSQTFQTGQMILPMLNVFLMHKEKEKIKAQNIPTS
ncbi:protein-export chaperone SecB [Clostridium sp. KNHs216]|uniref:protein-export chaperone SecB n=1 Tax=Clostridium sp. KNHs216 TaxID=1550235 RepID=UPI00163B4E73|nr:protein-export chaperone SecB [Clostridium sp. KNHs216]